jgi:hypothetical protein
VEVLWWRECPSWERAIEIVREEITAAGLPGDVLRVVEVKTEDEARSQGFPGSPTVRIDGSDILPPGDEPAGLTCRVYRRRDGRVSPLPDPLDVRDALAAALEGGSS